MNARAIIAMAAAVSMVGCAGTAGSGEGGGTTSNNVADRYRESAEDLRSRANLQQDIAVPLAILGAIAVPTGTAIVVSSDQNERDRAGATVAVAGASAIAGAIILHVLGNSSHARANNQEFLAARAEEETCTE